MVRTVHVTFNENVLPAGDGNQQARPGKPMPTIAVQDQQEADKQRTDGKASLNLLPLGSNLLQNRGKNQQRAEEDEEQAGNDGETNDRDRLNHEGESQQERRRPASVGDGENPYQRPYNTTSNRSEREWCQVEDCEIQGIHRAHTVIHYAYEAVQEVLGDPRSYDEAIKSADGDKWQRAAEEEYQSLVSNGTWTLCDRPVEVNIVGSKWIFKMRMER